MNPPGKGSGSTVRPYESLPFSPQKRNFMPYSAAKNLVASSASLPPRWPQLPQEETDDASVEHNEQRITLWGSEEDLGITANPGTSWGVKTWGHRIGKALKTVKQRLGIIPPDKRPRSRVTQSL